MANFNDLLTTKKGNIAETYAVEYLESIGYTLYWNTNHKSTPWDGIGYSGQTVRNLIEVKCKEKTKYGSYSIHENDLEKYEQAEKDENKKMLILYVDPSAGELNITTTDRIRKSTAIRTMCKLEHKVLIYFTSFKKRAELPETITEQLLNINLKQI